MKGIDNIITEILDGAKSDVDATQDQTKSQVTSIMQKAKDDVAKQIESMQKDIKAKCDEITRREKTILDVELRRNRLLVRRQLVDMAFDDAFDSLCENDKVCYDEIVMSMLLSAVETGSESIIASKDNRIDEALVEKANKALKNKGIDANLSLADQAGEFCGGFILQKGGIETNCTFGMLVSQLKPMIESEVASIIFPN